MLNSAACSGEDPPTYTGRADRYIKRPITVYFVFIYSLGVGLSQVVNIRVIKCHGAVQLIASKSVVQKTPKKLTDTFVIISVPPKNIRNIS